MSAGFSVTVDGHLGASGALAPLAEAVWGSRWGPEVWGLLCLLLLRLVVFSCVFSVKPISGPVPRQTRFVAPLFWVWRKLDGNPQGLRSARKPPQVQRWFCVEGGPFGLLCYHRKAKLVSTTIRLRSAHVNAHLDYESQGQYEGA